MKEALDLLDDSATLLRDLGRKDLAWRVIDLYMELEAEYKAALEWQRRIDLEDAKANRREAE